MQIVRSSSTRRRLLTVVPAVLFFSAIGQSIDAKGLIRSDRSSSPSESTRSTTDDSSRYKSDRRSNDRQPAPANTGRVEQRTQPQSDSRRGERRGSPSQTSRMGQRPTTPPVQNRTDDTVNTFNGRFSTSPRSGNTVDTFNGRFGAGSPSQAQSYTDRGQRGRDRDDAVSESRGLHRKYYEDIGKIWLSRSERRSTDRQHWDRDHYSGYHYNHYRYDYRPYYTYPSVYCYYYDYFPPYIDSIRIVYVPTYIHRYTYVELPLIVNDSDDYYLATPSRESYTTALRDIRDAWMRGDIRLVEDYIRSDMQIAVFNRGEYSYSIDSQDFRDMTSDAMQSIRTKDMRFDRVRRRDNGQVVAYGRHEYYDADGLLKTVYISYTLERRGSDWYIVEAGSSPFRIDDSQY